MKWLLVGCLVLSGCGTQARFSQAVYDACPNLNTDSEIEVLATAIRTLREEGLSKAEVLDASFEVCDDGPVSVECTICTIAVVNFVYGD